MASNYVPTSSLMEERLEELSERIPHFQLVDRVEGLRCEGSWAVALGSINHPHPDEGRPPLMLFAIFVVIDLTLNRVRMANPMPPGAFKEATLFKYMTAAMRDPMQGMPARPRQILCPQPSVARILRPLLLRVGAKVGVQDVAGFEPVFTLLASELLDRDGGRHP